MITRNLSTMWEGYTFSDTAKNMEVVADQLGISLQASGTSYSVRDPFIRIKDGSIKIAYESPQGHKIASSDFFKTTKSTKSTKIATRSSFKEVLLK